MPTLAQRMQSDADTLAFLEKAQTGPVEPAQPARFSSATGYDAVIDQGRRKRPSGVNRSEDQELTPFDRWRLDTAGRDVTGKNYDHYHGDPESGGGFLAVGGHEPIGFESIPHRNPRIMRTAAVAIAYCQPGFRRSIMPRLYPGGGGGGNDGRSLAEARDAAGHANVSITSAYMHVAVDDDAVGELFKF